MSRVVVSLFFVLTSGFAFVANAQTENLVVPVPKSLQEVPKAYVASLYRDANSVETLTLRLPTNASTGARWTVVGHEKDNFVKMTYESFHPDMAEINLESGDHIWTKVGSTSVAVFNFPQLPVGTHYFTLSYGRGWESKPWQTLVVTIKVSQK